MTLSGPPEVEKTTRTMVIVLCLLSCSYFLWRVKEEYGCWLVGTEGSITNTSITVLSYYLPHNPPCSYTRPLLSVPIKRSTKPHQKWFAAPKLVFSTCIILKSLSSMVLVFFLQVPMLVSPMKTSVTAWHPVSHKSIAMVSRLLPRMLLILRLSLHCCDIFIVGLC